MQTPSLPIDIVPLCLFLCALASVGCLWLARIQRDGPRYIVLWAISGAVLSTGVLLIILRDIVPDFVSILLGNLLLTAGYAYMAAGARAMYGANMVGIVPLALAGIGVFIAAYFTGSGLAERAAIMSATMLGFTLISLQVFALLALRTRSFGVKLATVALSINAPLVFVRMCLYLGVEHGLAAPENFDRYMLGAGVIVSLGMAVALVMLSARHLVLPRLVLRLAASPAYAGAGGHPLPAFAPDPEPVAKPAAPHGWLLRRSDMTLQMPNGEILRLTGNEFLVVQGLMQGGDDAPVSRASLNALIGRPADNPKDRAIDILISRLRRKCADAGVELPVISVRGQGYLFNGAVLGVLDGTAAK